MDSYGGRDDPGQPCIQIMDECPTNESDGIPLSAMRSHTISRSQTPPTPFAKKQNNVFIPYSIQSISVVPTVTLLSLSILSLAIAFLMFCFCHPWKCADDFSMCVFLCCTVLSSGGRSRAAVLSQYLDSSQCRRPMSTIFSHRSTIRSRRPSHPVETHQELSDEGKCIAMQKTPQTTTRTRVSHSYNHPSDQNSNSTSCHILSQ